MARYVIRRLGLAVVTLFILSVVVFVVASVLPGSVGRAILGPFALQESVDQINKELGVNGSLYSQYFHWISHAIRGDFGDSYKFQGPVTDYLASAFWSSTKLAVLTLIIVVPIGILGGAIAALRKDQASDRIITVTGLSLAVTPEFAIGIVLILFFAVKLRWVPAGGSADGSIIDQFKVLILPAVTSLAHTTSSCSSVKEKPISAVVSQIAAIPSSAAAFLAISSLTCSTVQITSPLLQSSLLVMYRGSAARSLSLYDSVTLLSSSSLSL